MKGVDLVRHPAQRPAARVVLTLEITLQNQSAATQYDDAVEVPDAPFGDRPIESRFEIIVQANLTRRGWRQARRVCLSSAYAARKTETAKSGEKAAPARLRAWHHDVPPASCAGHMDSITTVR